MRAVFVDTSAWDALEDSSDSNHAVAVRYRTILRQERMPLYVTNFVLDECLTLLLQNVGYVRTVAFKRTIDRMQTGGVLVAVHVSAEIEHAAWEVFERFNQDKTWSFTDCTTRVVMDSLGIRQVFAFDHHFDQMGFIRVPTSTPYQSCLRTTSAPTKLPPRLHQAMRESIESQLADLRREIAAAY